MKIYQAHALGAAIIFSILCMGLVGLFVMLPVFFIQWWWNAIAPSFAALPPISPWQASLLYADLVTVLYLAGLLQIEFEVGHRD